MTPLSQKVTGRARDVTAMAATLIHGAATLLHRARAPAPRRSRRRGAPVPQSGILIGDCRQALRGLAERSVHVCVTSPPYWGLRDYGSEGQIGLERTPEEYIGHLVEVFRAVRRVLRDDGVCWLNLGDSYATGGRGQTFRNSPNTNRDGTADTQAPRGHLSRGMDGKPGDLVGIPWRVALALQADGWYLRSDVIWAKRNTMPESVAGWRWERCRVKVATLRRGNNRGVGADLSQAGEHSGELGVTPSAEWSLCPGCPKCSANEGYVLRRGSWRPTKAHEMVFMLAKSERYFADGEGVREGIAPGTVARFGERATTKIGNPRTDAQITNHCGVNPAGRNLRDVWTLASQPSKLRHFAMMPPALVEKCILSGPEKVCEACGAPWARVVKREHPGASRSENGRGDGRMSCPSGKAIGSDTRRMPSYKGQTLGFRPTCACGAPAVPPLILDPFLGAGTVAGVAEVLGRRWAGCELSADYATLVPQRIEEVRAYFARQRTARAPQKVTR